MTFFKGHTHNLTGTSEGIDPQTGLHICVDERAIEAKLFNLYTVAEQATGRPLAQMTPDEIAALDEIGTRYFHTEYWVDQANR